MSGLCIKSDFTDYYDTLHNEDSAITYNRFISNSMQRGSALKYLRSLGIKTVDIKPVNQYFSTDGTIVVYTNPKGHNGTGKKILTVDEAQLYYGNCVASQYIESKDNLTIKFVQVGKRRFTLCFRKESPVSLDIGTLVDIKESSQEYNRLIGLPIFSIDYISSNNEMVATDFNEVQSLKQIGLDSCIGADSIIDEVRDAIITYNKII
jgi:hypothetical protein